MVEVYDVLNLAWKTYHFSAKSAGNLKALAGELSVNVLKPTQVTGTRWLPHVSRFKQFEDVLSKSDEKGGMEFQGIQMEGTLAGK